MDAAVVHQLFEGAYGAFVNTDGFAVGAANELNAAVIIVRVHFLQVSVTCSTFAQRMFDVVGDCLTSEASAFCLVKP